MKIYSMTATFGKLEHQTLTLQPGLNVIHAPNEWGKSTWCAFLLAMLYGIDTSARESKGVLPDKTRYAPWSGKPMSGSMDIHWNGKDITIQRGPKGRIPFGDFKAFETESGVPVAELTAANCGQTLLGVERSVFTRAGFLKLTDMPVTQDEALRRRLNALVTTGDESGAADDLAQKLKDLKNRCRHNKTGLLPQAEAQQQELEDKLQKLQTLQQQVARIQQRQQELTERSAQLENHRCALRYEAAKADAARVSEAEAAYTQAQETYTSLSATCEALPDRQAAEHALQTGKALLQQQMSLEMEEKMLPTDPEAPEEDPAMALETVQEDLRQLRHAEAGKKKADKLTGGLLSLCVVLAVALAILAIFGKGSAPVWIIGGAIICLTAIAAFILPAGSKQKHQQRINALYDRHPGLSPDRWLPEAESYAAQQLAYKKALADYQALRGDLDARKAKLSQQIADFAENAGVQAQMDHWNDVLATHNAMESAQRDLQQAQSYAENLRAMAKTAQPPQFPDTMTYTESETDFQLNSIRFEQHQLQQKLGQCQGQMGEVGQEESLNRQLAVVQARINRLEDTYNAITIAQKALADTTTELQRRFAPRITQRTQALFSQLTHGRYTRLTIGEDLSLSVAAQEQDTLCSVQYPSDGTVDQLYLALRLAVSEELTPEAPLILDDALVRFDDERLEKAMDILRQTAENKQILLFSCQKREAL